MKKHFSINLFLTILITSFITGCSNDENNKDLNSSIIGKWQLVSVSMNVTWKLEKPVMPYYVKAI